MRVTPSSFSNSLVDQLDLLASQQNHLQNEVSTGRRIQTPDDDPVGMSLVMGWQAEGQSLAQYQQNIASLQTQATASYNAINSLKTISDRAGEIATLADGTKSQADLKNYAIEVTQLIQQAVQLANGQQDGAYLFGGTRTDQPPFTVTTDANGVVTGVTYQGNAATASVEIDQKATVSALVPGANTSGTGPRGLITDPRSGADFFNHLISLQNHLQAGDTTGIAKTDRAALLQDENNLISQIASNGVLQSRLAAAASLASSRATAITGQISNEADANLADTITQLNRTQTAYQAAIQSGANIMRLSLLDYIQ